MLRTELNEVRLRHLNPHNRLPARLPRFPGLDSDISPQKHPQNASPSNTSSHPVQSPHPTTILYLSIPYHSPLAPRALNRQHQNPLSEPSRGSKRHLPRSARRATLTNRLCVRRVRWSRERAREREWRNQGADYCERGRRSLLRWRRLKGAEGHE